MQSEICQQKVLKFLKKPLKIKVLDSVSSTNDYIKDKDFDVVISKAQTKGRGTNNRSFFSPEGGIYFSVKLKNPSVKCEELSLITPLTAVAVLEAIEQTLGINAQIKWVNDIFIDGKKVAGILCESTITENCVDTVIVGIGINVKNQNFPEFNLNNPTSLQDQTNDEIDKNLIISKTLNAFYEYLNNLSKTPFLKKYRQNFYLLGKKVKINCNNKVYQGTVLGVDDNFNLLLEKEGQIIKFNCADFVREI